MGLRLKRLLLSGFKSFAKPTRFEFTHPITAIVGPNGAGKSNVAEAVRWILGEQSFKSLRGKKGEDLIFNGSPTAARLSKASATLYFDNSSRQFPVEFEEVIIGRRVYRDGQNDYLLNGSQVRLKDIVELLSNVGLGVSQHHIIGQGEADRILYASLKERQAMLEDALGLKIYQFKREEAERKLAKTEENMRQAHAIRKEVRPHLNHLEKLVEKSHKASEIRTELEKILREYIARSRLTIEQAEKDLRARREKPASDLIAAEKEIAALKNKILQYEKLENEPEELQETEKTITAILERRAKIERDLGRIEGALSASGANTDGDEELVAREDVEDLFSQVENILSSALDTDIIEEIYSMIQDAISRMSAFLGQTFQPKEPKSQTEELTAAAEKLTKELSAVADEEKVWRQKKEKLSSAFYEKTKERREIEAKIMQLEAEANKLRDVLRNFDLEEEKIKLYKIEFSRDIEDARRFIGEEQTQEENPAVFEEAEREKMRKEIDRLKFKLEEAGGVDPAIPKEYEEIKERDAFFARELDDLGRAAKSLRQISNELASKIEHDFNQGVEKINKEFQKFFEILFGGGRAKLAFIKPQKGAKDEDETAEGTEASVQTGGIDIDVSLPRKKIKGLDMLSGGERALTSIALLFAMSTVNPPPFLVLDETDAALDEANSRRYSEMLKNLSRTTQIITITHNRETMRQSGVLYGVTMGSDGVSRLLSLKLSEAEEIAGEGH